MIYGIKKYEDFKEIFLVSRNRNIVDIKFIMVIANPKNGLFR